jgi:Glycosyltransferase family 87
MTGSYLRAVVRVWGLLVAVALVMVMTALADPFDPDSFGPGQDARAYWAAPLDDPYVAGSVGQESAYLYSPAFLVATSPLRALPWPLFVGVWTALLLGVLYWLTRPLLFLPMLLLTLPEIWGGNITILLAAAIVVGLSRPAAWAFTALTKVTPAIGLLWFAVRREWSQLAVALLATAAIIGVTAILTPGLWAEWMSLLGSSTGSSTVPGSVPIPFVLRLPVAVLVIAWAARTDRAWLLPVGILLAMPVIWWGSLAILAASVAFERERIEAHVDRTLGLLEERRLRRAAAKSIGASTA